MKSRPWAPQPGPQLAAIDARWCDEILFGGARGGGKSDFLLGDYCADAANYGEDWKGILFRKTYKQLEELVSRSRQIIPACYPGSEFIKSDWFWKLPTGSTLKMRHIETVADVDEYQGHQYTWIGWDELGNWADQAPYKMLVACLRNGNRPIPYKRIRGSANPGGAGHQWVKARFIDPAPQGNTVVIDEETGMKRMFIPSRVGDNKILIANDPKYVARLKGVGSPELVRAWLEGDWSVVTGAYFDRWSNDRHVIRPFRIPSYWVRFRAFDWGSAAPFSVGWWAISDGSILEDGRHYPSGAMIRYREWYGAKGPNEGLKLTAEEVARDIVIRSRDETYSYSVADPSCFSKTTAAGHSGPSVAERMYGEGVAFMRADNQRLLGWDQVRARLAGDGDGLPMIYCFSDCLDSIRTIPSLQHDPKIPEDLDTDAEDHAADEWRYACMSRPFVRKASVELPMRGALNMTFDEAVKLAQPKSRNTGSRI